MDICISQACQLDVYTDGQRIQQVYLNLLSNAIKFSPMGGRIMVRAKIGCKSNLSEKYYFDCRVIDEGPGIHPRDVPRIFDPYLKSKRRGSPQFGRPRHTIQGNGLGLALCKCVCQNLKGSIMVKDTSNRGTEMEFKIPIKMSQGATSNPLANQGNQYLKYLISKSKVMSSE